MSDMRIHAIAGGLAAVVLGACAPGVGTIDRTQPNAISKSQFAGLWYTRSTIIAADPGSSAGVDGYGSDLDKIRWEITEGVLIGYRTYEFLPYAEGLTDDGRDFFGAPVVAFPILSHFDIQWDYNKTTGVERNVLVENSTDRPWYERQYVRVDWSQNMVGRRTKFFTGFTAYPDAYFAGEAITARYEQGHEATNPDRPVFTSDYFDVTNTYQVEPDDYYCLYNLMFNGAARCGAQTVKVRLAFMKVDPANDYQKMYYPDNEELKDDSGRAIVVDFNGRPCGQAAGATDPRQIRDPSDCRFATFPYFESFGNFRINRVAYDSERGMTRSGRIFLAGRFNIWKDSFNDTTGRPRDYADREPKPIIYYGNVGLPNKLVKAGKDMGDYWSPGFDETVAYLQGLRTSDGRGDIEGLRNKYSKGGKTFQMFEFRQNSCNVANIQEYARKNGLESVVEETVGSVGGVTETNVENVCAAVQFAELKAGKSLDAKEIASGKQAAFQWEREGDLRYSIANYVEPEDFDAPWGVAQFAVDPETGEYLATAANYFGDSGDFVSQREVDRLQWLNGDISEQDLLKGDVTRNMIVSRRTAANTKIRDDVFEALSQRDQDLVNSGGDDLFRSNGPSDDPEARYNRMFKGTDLERELLVTDELLRGMAGPMLYQPVSVLDRSGGSMIGRNGKPLVPGEISDDAINAASPMNWGMGLDSNQYMKAIRDLGSRGIEFAEFFEPRFDPQNEGLARFTKGKSREWIFDWLQAQLFTAVEGHEVGHTLGLRHNFGGSMDPLNYKRDFWEKGYWDHPPAKDNTVEANRGVEFKYSSIMDYGFGVSTEGLHGMGEYDMAALRFLYGELVDVWNPSKVSVPDPRKYGSFARRCGHDSSFWGFGFLLTWLGWESIPSILSVDPGEGNKMDELYQELARRVDANAAGQQDPTGCAISLQDVKYVLDEVQKLEPREDRIFGARMLVKADDLKSMEKAALLNRPEYDDAATPGDESADGVDDDGDGVADDIGGVQDFFGRGGEGVNWSNYLQRVPYEFCPDDFAGYSPGCQVWDTGADFLESVRAHISAYDLAYVFDNFRRDRYNWGNTRNYVNNLSTRRLFHMTNVFRYYLYTRRSALADTPRVKRFQEATYEGLNFLERIIQTPEPGRHCLDRGTNMYVAERFVSGACEEPLDVGLGYGEGKYLTSAWSNEQNYKANRIGVFYDKMAAIWQLTSSSGRFIRDFSDFFNRRAFTLGYLRADENPMIQRFSGLIRGDHTKFRSAVVTETDEQTGQPRRYVRYMPFTDEKRDDGSSVRRWLEPLPKIEPAWSWSLQYHALAAAITNWSSLNDSTLEFFRLTKISIAGLPEDVEYGPNITVVEFTDPESRLVYRSPDLAARSAQGLAAERGYERPHTWGVGADILRRANDILNAEYLPKQQACNAATGPEKRALCQDFQQARRKLNEYVGFIDIVRRFNRRAEMP